MTDAADLLPASASKFERVLARAIDPTPDLAPTIDALHGLKINNPPQSYLPYLVWEGGLGMLSPFVPDLYELLIKGEATDWQRERGDREAVYRALGWIGYSARLEYAPPRRRWWNQTQIELGRLRDDEADLIPIDGLTRLSIPYRSDFWRGYHGYDVRALESDKSRWDDTLWDDDSGVVLPGGTAKWSFGRRIDYEYAITPEDLGALGINDPWALTLNGEPLTLGGEALRFVPAGGRTKWGGPWLALPWRSSDILTASVGTLVAAGDGPAWAVFKNSEGEVLFYRRCRVRRRVIDDAAGVYRVGAAKFSPTSGAATRLYLEALTDFGEGEGTTAASVGFILTAMPAAGPKPGVAHLPPGGLEPAGPVIAEHPVSIDFSCTVREGVACLLRF